MTASESLIVCPVMAVSRRPKMIMASTRSRLLAQRLNPTLNGSWPFRKADIQERRANRRCTALSRSVQRPKGARLSPMLALSELALDNKRMFIVVVAR